MRTSGRFAVFASLPARNWVGSVRTQFRMA
jgi:hypothetical protein